jgi:hypothetical protein
METVAGPGLHMCIGSVSSWIFMLLDCYLISKSWRLRVNICRSTVFFLRGRSVWRGFDYCLLCSVWARRCVEIAAAPSASPHHPAACCCIRDFYCEAVDSSHQSCVKTVESVIAFPRDFVCIYILVVFSSFLSSRILNTVSRTFTFPVFLLPRVLPN